MPTFITVKNLFPTSALIGIPLNDIRSDFKRSRKHNNGVTTAYKTTTCIYKVARAGRENRTPIKGLQSPCFATKLFLQKPPIGALVNRGVRGTMFLLYHKNHMETFVTFFAIPKSIN